MSFFNELCRVSAKFNTEPERDISYLEGNSLALIDSEEISTLPSCSTGRCFNDRTLFKLPIVWEIIL